MLYLCQGMHAIKLVSLYASLHSSGPRLEKSRRCIRPVNLIAHGKLSGVKLVNGAIVSDDSLS